MFRPYTTQQPDLLTRYPTTDHKVDHKQLITGKQLYTGKQLITIDSLCTQNHQELYSPRTHTSRGQSVLQ